MNPAPASTPAGTPSSWRSCLSEWLLGAPSALFTARGLCILGVVMIHFTGGRIELASSEAHDFTRLLYLGMNQWFQFVVPTFVFLSGYALSGKSVAWPEGIRPFYRRRAGALLWAFACFVVYYLAYEAPQSEISAKGASLGSLVPWVLYYGMDTHAYFVPMIFQLYLVFPVLSVWSSHVDRRGAAGFVWTEWAVLLGALLAHLWLCHVVWGAQSASLRDIRPLGLYYLVYFCWGMRWRSWAGRMGGHRRLLAVLAVTGAAVQVLAWGSAMGAFRTLDATRQMAELQFACFHPRSVIQSLGMCLSFGALLLLRPNLRIPLVQTWGQHSLGIFLWHGLVLWTWFFGVPNPFQRVPSTTAALLIPVVACTLISGLSLVFAQLKERLHR